MLFRGKTNKQQDFLHSLKGSQEGLGPVAAQLRGRRGMGGEEKGVAGWADGRKAGKCNFAFENLEAKL